MLDFFSEDFTTLMSNMHIPDTYFKDSVSYRYWFRSLMHKIDSSVIFKNLPKGWNNDFFMFCLWVRGYVLVFETKRKELQKYGENGIVFQPCYLSGTLDFYWTPTKATIANPNIANININNEFTLGKKAHLLKLTPDYLGVLDIIDFYAAKLAELSKSVDMSILNSKLGVIATATNEAQSQTLKAIYDKLMKGESLIVFDDLTKEADEVIPRKEPFNMWVQELKKNYILTDQLNDMQTILNSFYSEIGLPVAVEKKERLVTTEADFAVAQSQARISCWVETLKESLEVINLDLNCNIEVEYAGKNDNTGNTERVSKEESGTVNN